MKICYKLEVGKNTLISAIGPVIVLRSN